MNRCIRKFLSVLLIMTIVIAAVLPAAASADADMRRAVVGADLTEEQIESVYQLLGIRRGDVQELRLSNAEEHAALDGYLDQAIIGTKSMSCVLLELLPQNSGISVNVQNVSWCTPEMYRSALVTAGLTDARITVAAPFPVSGTAALAGIYKAYEDMTGQKLDTAAKDVSTRELTVTGELANEIGSSDSTSIVNELKQILNETVSMSDEELHARIRKIASGYGVNLTESQVRRLAELCRSMEKLNPDALTQRADEIQSTLEKVSEAKDQVVGFMQTMKQFFQSIRDFFDRVASLFDGR